MALALDPSPSPSATFDVPLPATGPATGSASLTTEELLARIDGTLGLIAEANSVASGATPLDRFDVSVIVPVHNARHSLPDVLDRIDEVMPPATETIVIDDGSTDGSWQYLRGRALQAKAAQAAKSTDPDASTRRSKLIVMRRRRHHGRGSTIRMAVRHTRGHVVSIQDADMAYDPADLLGAIWPILEDKADAVYGSRTLRRGFASRRGLRGLTERAADWWLTRCSNRFTGLKLSDLTAGHKVFRGEMIRGLELSETGAGFDAEVTAKIARHARVVMEVPTHYEATWRTAASPESIATWSQVLQSTWRHRRA